ncbi:MAG: molybdopterin-dependent oxidoreductase [Deltaproteobacteria bacterium]|jgi:aldehyde oxidoreductase|nr:molybdopterin-dependent oxidoreductase [Deltaproteobacteria bacterium]
MGYCQKIFCVNGVKRSLIVDDNDSLADVLRGQLLLTSCKIGCGEGQCGACNVIIDGKLVKSCVYKMKRLPENACVTTLEGIGTPDKLHPLQQAWIFHGGAQCGFCTPGFIVSAKALLDSNPKPTRAEVRDWFQKNRNACRCTGYIPLVDAVMDGAAVMRGEKTVEDITFKMPADGHIWGSTIPRPSALAKVTGTADYGADFAHKMPPDTLHLALAQAKVSHALIKGIDTSEAEKMPGVHSVLTYKDVKGTNRINGLAFPTNKGDGWERPILCEKKVFQYGDALAIVCADTECHARAAAEKVKVDLEVLPAYMNVWDAIAPDAIEIHPGTPNEYYEQPNIKGSDTAPIFKQADVSVEGDYYVGRQPHMPVEPDVGFAYIDEKGKCIIHSKSIGVHLHGIMIQTGLGRELNKDLELVQNVAGGTFGYKFSPTMEALCGVAAIATGRPVHLRYNWEQQQQYTGKRSPFYVNLKYAATREGKLLGMEADWYVDHGPYSEFGDLLTLRGAQFIGAGYNIPNIKGKGHTICTNHAWGSAFRAYGAPQSCFATEVLMDELAEKLRMDPLELRYKNCYRPGSTNSSGQTPEVFSFPKMCETLKPKYEAALAKAGKNSTAEVKRGVGLAFGAYGCGLDGPDTALCWVEYQEDGGVLVGAAWGSHGQGATSGILCTSHEALFPMGIAPEKIRILGNDTARVPAFGPAGGSRTQVVGGNSLRVACQNLVEAAKKSDGGYMTPAEMKAAGKPLRYDGTWTAPAKPCDANGQGSPFCCYMYGLFMAEVAVEIATGNVTVEKMTLAADIGSIANKLTVDGQLYGGLAQGIGLALTEDFEDIHKHSTMNGAGFPFIKQIPDDMELIYVSYPRPDGPFGASGVGEMPLTSPHASISNAIYNACGARIRHLPARPEKVLAELTKRK